MVRDVVLKASAKINLDLRVVGRRPDGFHELRTVFQTLALHDRLLVRRSRGPIRLECDAPGVPTDERNLAWRAAAAAWRLAGRRGRVRGVTLTIEKRIPAAAGLGGGSSDAAAALVGVNHVLELGLPPGELHRAACEVGSDVPFFLVGGTALGLGRGEDVYALADLPAAWVLLVRPPFGVHTADAYRWLRTGTEHGVGCLFSFSPAKMRKGTRPQSQPLAVAWRPGGLSPANDLERAVLPRHPEIAAAKRALLDRGASVALMAGSGSTVFGLFSDPRAARAAAVAVRRPGWTIILTRTLGRSAYLGRLAGDTLPTTRARVAGAGTIE